jgi:hypothetical protein
VEYGLAQFSTRAMSRSVFELPDGKVRGLTIDTESLFPYKKLHLVFRTLVKSRESRICRQGGPLSWVTISRDVSRER